MTPRLDRPGQAAERRFFLATRAGEELGIGERTRLAEADVEHARVVLRLSAGDRCVGLDGSGRSWPLLVTRVDKRSVEVEATGAPTQEPAPGEPGAALPWIEMAVAWPKGPRAEDMVAALAQLGAAALTPLVSQRSGPGARGDTDGRQARLARIARESSKQSGRLWNLHIGPSLDLEGLAARGEAVFVRCDPHARGAGLLRGLATGSFTRSRPLIVAIGPEGGFTPSEEAWLEEHRAVALGLGPHILRTETAATAALALVVAALGSRVPE